MEDVDLAKSTLHLLAFQTIQSLQVERLLPLLSDGDSVVRALAAQQLQLKGDDLVFKEIAKLTRSPVDYTRESVAFIMGQLGTPERPYKNKALPYLLDMINDKSDIVRSAAVSALGHLYVDERMPNEVSDLVVCLATDSSSQVRSCVAFALGHSLRSSVVVDALNKLKKDPNEDVRSYAELGFELLS